MRFETLKYFILVTSWIDSKKKLAFSGNFFWAMKLSIILNIFRDKFGSKTLFNVFFMQAVRGLKNWRISNSLKNDSVRKIFVFFKQAIWVLQLWTISLHFLAENCFIDWTVSRENFSSKLFGLWKLEIFRVLF